MKNNEQNVLTENPVSILWEIRTRARLNSTDFNIKSFSQCQTIRYQVASFEALIMDDLFTFTINDAL